MSAPYGQAGAHPVGAEQLNYADQQHADQQHADQQHGDQQHSGGYQPGSGQAMTEDGHPDVEGASVGQLISEVTTDLSVLMRQEIELAKAEIKAEANKATAEVKAQATKAGKGAGMLGGAGFAGYFVVLFLSLALMWALASAIPTGWAALIVAVVWAIIAAVLAAAGRSQLKKIDFSGLKNINPKPEQTVETLQQVPGALKPS